eukprot:scaffold138639_cov21-Tisochrysis_lutea.AAC.3
MPQTCSKAFALAQSPFSRFATGYFYADSPAQAHSPGRVVANSHADSFSCRLSCTKPIVQIHAAPFAILQGKTGGVRLAESTSQNMGCVEVARPLEHAGFAFLMDKSAAVTVPQLSTNNLLCSACRLSHAEVAASCTIMWKLKLQTFAHTKRHRLELDFLNLRSLTRRRLYALLSDGSLHVWQLHPNPGAAPTFLSAWTHLQREQC